MKTNLKYWIMLFALVLAGCAPLPLNGIVTITPAPTLIPVSPTALSTATSLPETPTRQVATLPALPLPASSTPAAPTQALVTETPSVFSTPSSAILQGLVEKARLDLSSRLSISAAEITLLRADQVSWADLSLGCPKPGMAYGQMITAGYLVVLGAGGARYEYHAGPSQALFYCDKPQPPITLDPSAAQ